MYDWDKVIANIKKKFDSKHAYIKNFLKSKTKSYGDGAADFHSNEMPKVGSNHTCLSVLTIDSFF